ncbi:hypothetical protein TrRE_jg7487, partial [Triparma retinervis]
MTSSKKIVPHPSQGSSPGTEETPVVEHEFDGEREDDDSEDRVGDEENMENGQVEEEVAAEDGKEGLASALPSCLLILLMKFVNDNLVKLGGFFGDMHVVRCFGCLLYIDAIFLVLRGDRAFTKKMLLCKVPGQITFMVAVSIAFDWKLGPWTFVVATLAWSFGEMCTYIIDMQEQPRPPVIKYMVTCLVIGFVMHGSIATLISALVVPTKYLAEEENDEVTMLVTGIVFP